MALPDTARLERIASKETEAAVLLVRAMHDDTKEQVRRAMRELAEATHCLGRLPEGKEATGVVTFVDQLTFLAETRLRLVENALQARGPNATVLC